MKKTNNFVKKSIPYPKLWLFFFCMAHLLLSCTSKSDQMPRAPHRVTGTYADYVSINARIAVQAGSVYGDVARNLFQAGSAPEYVSIADMLEALRMGRVDAALLSHSYIRQLVDSGMYPNYDYLWVPKEVYVNEAAPIFNTEELRDQYNEWFRGIATDGTWGEIVDRWIGVPLPAQEDIPQF